MNTPSPNAAELSEELDLIRQRNDLEDYERKYMEQASDLIERQAARIAELEAELLREHADHAQTVEDAAAVVRENKQIAAALAQQVPAVPSWVPVTEAMPASGVTVLACYRNRLGNLRRIRANWIAAKSAEASSDSDSGFAEYDEATDTYYDPEGWYERIDNWGDYSAVAVCEGEVTHWMPLPAAPLPTPEKPA